MRKFFTGKIAILILLTLTFASHFAFSDPSFINNTGGATLATRDGNVSIGTLESKGKLHVNGSIYQNQLTPRIIGYITDQRLDGAFGVYVQGKYAYVAASSNDSLSIIDISNPSSPSVVGHITDARLDGGRKIYVQGKYAYIPATSNQSFSVIDISNASSPKIVGNVVDNILLATATGIYVSGKYAYVAGAGQTRFLVIDISNPFSPSIVSSLFDVRIANLFNIYVAGKYAYTASAGSNVRNFSIIDISDPITTKIVGYVDSPILDISRGVYVSGSHAYLTAYGNDSFVIININNKTSPFIEGSIITNALLDSPRDVYVSGKYVYAVAETSDNLVIIDVSNASSPAIIASVADSSRLNGASGLFVQGKYAYVASQFNDSLSIIDISGIDSPAASIGAVEAGSLSVTENAQVANDLYVGNGLNVGPGGAYINGRVSIFATPDNTSAGALLTVGNTTTSLVAIFGEGSGKIDAGLVDPVYTISGKQYSTYVCAMTGVKEETTGTVDVKCSDNLCGYVINFEELEEGSDLWLFAKVTNLKKNIDKMAVLLTPEFDGLVWYEKDSYRLTIFGEKAGVVNYRLTAPRFDHEKWSNYNNDGTRGYVIEDD